MSKKQKARNREIIQGIRETLVRRLSERLEQAGLTYRIITKQANTGSVYVKIKTNKKHGGAAVRISDHRKNPSDRWVNFSKPAKRYYGIWFRSTPARIERKARRIADNVIRINRKWGEA